MSDGRTRDTVHDVISMGSLMNGDGTVRILVARRTRYEVRRKRVDFAVLTSQFHAGQTSESRTVIRVSHRQIGITARQAIVFVDVGHRPSTLARIASASSSGRVNCGQWPVGRSTYSTSLILVNSRTGSAP